MAREERLTFRPFFSVHFMKASFHLQISQSVRSVSDIMFEGFPSRLESFNISNPRQESWAKKTLRVQSNFMMMWKKGNPRDPPYRGPRGFPPSLE